MVIPDNHKDVGSNRNKQLIAIMRANDDPGTFSFKSETYKLGGGGAHL